MPFKPGNKHGHRFREGYRNPNAKLNPEKVRYIRDQYSGPQLNRAAWRLAEDFGVSDVAIYKVVNRETWNWLP